MAKLKPGALFGLLCDNECIVPSSLKRALRKRMPSSEILPVQVAHKFLKNTVKCTRLIEVSGLVVADEYCDKIWRHIPDLTPEAYAAQRVDVIEKNGHYIIGHNTIGEAGAAWVANNLSAKGTSKTAILVGKAPLMVALAGGLLGSGWKVVHWMPAGIKRPPLPGGISRITKSSSIPPAAQLIVIGELQKKPAVTLACITEEMENLKLAIDLRDGSNSPLSGRLTRLSRCKLASLSLDVCVDILTS